MTARNEGPDRDRTSADDVRWPDPDGWATDRTSDRSGARPGTVDEPSGDEVPWSWTDGLALIAWWLVASTIVGTVAVVLGVEIFEDRTAFLAVGAISQVVTLLGALAWLAIRGALSRRLVGAIAPVGRYLGLGVLVGVGGWLGMTMLLAAVVIVLGIEELPTQESLESIAVGDTTTILVGLVLAVVLAPIVEELIYRGVLFQGLRASIGAWPAIVLSSVIFGAIHLDTILQDGVFVAAGLIPMLGITLVGGLWAWVFHRTGSLIVPIVGHAVFNGIAVVLALLTLGDGETPFMTIVPPFLRMLALG